MKLKSLFLAILLLVIVLGLFYTFSIKSSDNTVVNLPENQQYEVKELPEEVVEEVNVEDASENIVITEQTPELATISILRTVFSPKTITIKKGATVMWINKDDNVHVIKAQIPANSFRSERIDPGESFSVTFNEPGEYTYIDSISTFMSGKIIVEGSSLAGITGNYLLNISSFSASPKNVTALLLFICLGLIIINTFHKKK